MKEISSESKSNTLNEILNKEAGEFAKIFIGMDDKSKQFLAGYIVAKNEQRDIQNSKRNADEGVIEFNEN